MFKKENLMTTIFIGIIGLVFALAIVGMIGDKEEGQGKKPADDGKKEMVTYENEPMLGNEEAPVQIMEFADFKCPYCKQWTEDVFPKLKADYIDTGKVQFYFKNFAFIGPDSITSAVAGEAIYKQNPEAFWTYYDLMFENQGDEQKVWATKNFIMKLTEKNIKGLDYDQLEKDIEKNAYYDEVQSDNKQARDNQIQSTPSIVINGTIVPDPYDYDAIKTMIDEALESSSAND